MPGHIWKKQNSPLHKAAGNRIVCSYCKGGVAYKIVGITDKGTAAGSQLDDLSLVEHLIAHTLRTGMAAGRGYKDIYLDCKHRLESMKYLQCTA